MADLMIELANSWSQALEWFHQSFDRVQTLPPAILIALAAPCALALLLRSLTALSLCFLLALVAITALGTGMDERHHWIVALAAASAGLLAVVQAGALRDALSRQRDAEARLGARQRELDEVGEKYEREVLWRKAGGGTAAKQRHSDQADSLT
jgi:peptidoglycan/LPS O-acetylase OafA/YrhL